MSDAVNDVLRQLYGEGKPQGLVVFAILIASAADPIREYVHRMQSGKPLGAGVPGPPPVDQWLKLYRRHRRIMDATGILAGITDGQASLSQASDIGRMFAAMSVEDRGQLKAAMTEEEQRQMQQAWQQMVSLFVGVKFPPSLPEVRKLVQHFDRQAQAGDGMEQLIAQPGMQFLLRVWLPCYIQYRTYPPRLYRRARQGDLDALDDLLRLDKSVLADPRIGEQWHQAMHTKRGGCRRLLAAVQGRPRGSFTDSKVRAALAGLISQLALQFHCPMTEREIRALFNLVAQARTKALVDGKLPISSEALSKAIQRQRRWPSLPQPDKNSL